MEQHIRLVKSQVAALWTRVRRFWAKAPCADTASAERSENITADDEFAWVPEWLSNPSPPTPAAIRGAEVLRELRAKKSR